MLTASSLTLLCASQCCQQETGHSGPQRKLQSQCPPVSLTPRGSVSFCTSSNWCLVDEARELRPHLWLPGLPLSLHSSSLLLWPLSQPPLPQPPHSGATQPPLSASLQPPLNLPLSLPTQPPPGSPISASPTVPSSSLPPPLATPLFMAPMTHMDGSHRLGMHTASPGHPS